MGCCQREHHVTESVCPVCLAAIPALRLIEGDAVYLQKTCPVHGEFKTILWRGTPAMQSWINYKIPAHMDHPLVPVSQGCPYDCGLCPEHRQQTCTALLEVTQRCNLRCSYCFADATGLTPDPDLSTIQRWYQKLLDVGGPYNIQLSGGEPTLRDDLPEIIALGKQMDFGFIQINTNGLRLGRDTRYVARLKQAGLSSVFLQFDGTQESIHETLRGERLLQEKLAAIEACTAYEIGIVLVPTLVPGVNDRDIGEIIRLALRYAPAVRGVHFQPVSYFGRYPSTQAPRDEERMTIPEVMRAIQEQTGGAVRAENLKPGGCENALCSFHGNFVVMPDQTLYALTRRDSQDCCKPIQAEEGARQNRAFIAHKWAAAPRENACTAQKDAFSLGEWDTVIQRTKTHSFTISGMAFQDAWNLDLERLRDCCIHVVSPDERLIPFCAYNLTDTSGRALYRGISAAVA